MNGPRRVAIFPALVRRQTLGGCERRLFFIALFMGALPGLYGGLFANRVWMMALGTLLSLALIYVFSEMTKHDDHCREVIVNSTYYKAIYVAVARWDKKPKVRR